MGIHDQTHGKSYNFVSREEFLKIKEDKGFIETAEFSGIVHSGAFNSLGNLYGTSIKAINDVKETGKICVLDLEVNGVKSLKKLELGGKYMYVVMLDL